jgi:hypothetical protein
MMEAIRLNKAIFCFSINWFSEIGNGVLYKKRELALGFSLIKPTEEYWDRFCLMILSLSLSLFLSRSCM